MPRIKCPLCGETIDRNYLRLHLALDKWLMSQVEARNPDWKEPDGSCPKCGREAERLKKEAAGIELLKQNPGRLAS